MKCEFAYDMLNERKSKFVKIPGGWRAGSNNKWQSKVHGSANRKKSNECNFVLTYRFIQKIFWMVRGPVSDFCTPGGRMERKYMQENFFG